jgi:hypothetical protein
LGREGLKEGDFPWLEKVWAGMENQGLLLNFYSSEQDLSRGKFKGDTGIMNYEF